MVWTMIGSILGAFVGWRLWLWQGKPDFLGYNSSSIWFRGSLTWPGKYIYLGALLGSLLGTILGISISLFLHQSKTETLVRDINLASLRNTNEFSGSFFLGIGTIGETQYYNYFEGAGNGYRFSKLPADNPNVVIIEEERRDGTLRLFVTRHSRGGDRHNSLSAWSVAGESEYVTRWEFHIPRGSIQRNFVLQ